VVQFQYGEDGLDVTQVSYLKQYAFMARNAAAAALRMGLPLPSSGTRQQQQQLILAKLDSAMEQMLKREGPAEQAVAAYLHKRTKLLRKALKGDSDAAQELLEGLPLSAQYSHAVLGVTSEAFQDALLKYCIQDPDRFLLEAPDSSSSSSSSKGAKKSKQQQLMVGPTAGLMSKEGESCRTYTGAAQHCLSTRALVVLCAICAYVGYVLVPAGRHRGADCTKRRVYQYRMVLFAMGTAVV